MKKLLLLVIFICPVVCNAGRPYVEDGWKDDVWPSSDFRRFSDTNDFYIVTNIFAVRVDDKWTVTAKEDFVPNAIPEDQWNGFAFTEPSLSANRKMGGSFLTNDYKFTNTYFRGIKAGLPYLDSLHSTNFFTNKFIFIFPTVTMAVERAISPTTNNFTMNVAELRDYETFRAINERLVALGQTEMEFALYRNEFNTNTETVVLQFNSRANIIAVKTKIESIMGNFANPLIGETDFDTYFDENPILQWVDSNHDGTNNVWNRDHNTGQQGFPVMQVTSLVANISGFPFTITETIVTNTVPGFVAGNTNVFEVTNFVHTLTNTITQWFDYTPTRDLGGYALGRNYELTSTWTFVINPQGLFTNTITNIISTSCSDVITNTFAGTTNSITMQVLGFQKVLFSQTYTMLTTQEVSVVCTNDEIDVDFNTGDYGWKYIPQVLDQLVWTYRNGNDSGDGWGNATNNARSGTDNVTDTNGFAWVLAQGGAESNYAAGSPSTLAATPQAENTGTAASDDNRVATLVRRFNVASITNLTTNFNKTVDFYVRNLSQISFFSTNRANDSYIFDMFGDETALSWNSFVYFRYTGNSDIGLTNDFVITTNIFGLVSLPTPNTPWVDEPDTNGFNRRGYDLDGDLNYVIKFDKDTNSFIFINPPIP